MPEEEEGEGVYPGGRSSYVLGCAEFTGGVSGQWAGKWVRLYSLADIPYLSGVEGGNPSQTSCPGPL